MTMNGTGLELTESELKALVGEAEWERITQADDSQVPTLVVGRDQPHDNVFIAFQSRSEVEYLLSQLTSLLVHQQGDQAEYAVSVRGQIMTSGNYYDLTPQSSEDSSDEAVFTPYD